MNEKPIGSPPYPASSTPLPPILPVEALLRQLRLVHVAFVLGIFALGTAWGLKLEYRLDVARADHDQLVTRVAELEHITARGILPLTEERIARMVIRQEQIASDHSEMGERIAANVAEIERLKLEWTRWRLEHGSGRRGLAQ